MNKALVSLLALVLIGLSAASIKQVSYWKNGGTLFERELKLNPEHGIAAINAGMYYQGQMDYVQAYEKFEIAIADPRSRYYGYIFKGFLMQQEGRHDDAITQYIRATESEYLDQYHYLKILFENLIWLLYNKKNYQAAKLFAEQGKQYISDHSYLDHIIDKVTKQVK